VVDAHADLNTPEGSQSKNLHGQPFSFLMRFFDTNEIAGFNWLSKCNKLNPRNIA
jgi:arginase